MVSIHVHIKALLPALFVFLMVASATAQPKKFGEINVLDFSAYDSKYDSTSSAVVLFVKGNVEFDSDYNCILEFHKRIKILNDDGFNYGDIEIPVYKDRDQDVYGIKATTYTLQENGTIEEKKLGRRDVFDTEVREDLVLKKFTMPDLSPGVIIEYTYKKNLGNPFYLPDWKFHDYIPVQWSEIDMIIPNSLNYQMIFKGKDSLFIKNIEKRAGIVNNVRTQRFQLAKKDLPPVEDLPYLINRDDHLSELFTQLRSIRIPGINPQNYFKSWENIASELNERGDFGKQRPDGAIRDKVEELVNADMTELRKVEAIYNYLVNNFEWDGLYRLVTEKGIRDTFRDKEGSTGDLNFLLIEMLREAGVAASPGLLSTRDNGTVMIDYPLVTQFNMLVAVVEIGNSAFIVDVSSGDRSLRFPHPEILYRNAFVIREDDSYGWLTTVPIDNTYRRMSIEYSLADSSRIYMNIQSNLKGAYSEEIRQDVKSINFNSYWEDEFTDLPGLVVDSSNFENLENLSENVTYQTAFSFEKDESLSLNQDIIYFQPFLFKKLEENPFKKPERQFPVEFPFPSSEQMMVNVKIPEGYVVDEIPETKQFMLPNGGGYYRFMSSVSDSTLTFVSTTNIASVYYPPEEYASIKELFQTKVDATNATVVLKKESSE